MSAPDPRALACPSKIPLALEGPSTQAVYVMEADEVEWLAAQSAVKAAPKRFTTRWRLVDPREIAAKQRFKASRPDENR